MIIPVFNAGEYLSSCLDSALRQDFGEHEIEIICIDDCSTDNSWKILSEYSGRFRQVTAIRNETNSGVSISRNRGLGIASGKYITFLDADDMIADNAYAETVKALEESSCNTVVWYYGCHEDVSFFRKVPGIKFEPKSARTMLHCPTAVWRIMVMRNTVEEHHLSFAPHVSYGEDLLFSFLLFLAQQKETILYTEQRLYFYRIVDGSLSKTAQNSRNWYAKFSENMRKLALFLYGYLQTAEGYDKKQRQQITRRAHRYSAKSVYNAVKAKRNDIRELLADLSGHHLYPYKLRYVFNPVEGGGTLKNALTVLSLLILNIPIVALALGCAKQSSRSRFID